VFFSLCYVLLRRVLQLAALRFSVERVQGGGNRRVAARTRRPSPTNPPSGDDPDRPAVLGGGQPTPAARPVAGVHRHTGDAASLASAPGGEALDVRVPRRSPGQSGVRSERWSCVWRGITRGGAINAGGDERSWIRGRRDDGAELASESGARTRRQARRDDLAPVHTSASAEHARGGFLHRRDDLVVTALRALLHRTGQPPSTCRGMHGESECAVGHATGPAADMDPG
jgi:hypothetical protein